VSDDALELNTNHSAIPLNALKGLVMEWIAAKLQLPGTSERVLLFTPYPISGDEHTFIGNRESITNCTMTINRRPVPVFTHWMPLPPNPVEPA